MTLKEITDKRVTLVKEAQRINDAAVADKREMTALESEQFDKLMGESDQLDEQRDTITKAEKRASWLADQNKSEGRKTEADKPGDDEKRFDRNSPAEVRTMTWGEDYVSPRSIKLDGGRASEAYRDAFARYMAYGSRSAALAVGNLTDEERALQADSDTVGGYLVTPLQFVANLIKFVDNAVRIRQMATVFQVPNAQSLGAPSLDTDMADTDWTAEILTGSEDSSIAFGQRELHPHPMAKLTKVSNTLMRKAIIGPEQLVVDRLGYKVAVTQEKGFMTGTGSNQPLGIFTASASGVPTTQDVSTGNSTTAIATDNLIEVKYSLKEQHQAEGTWIFHRDALKNIRKLKDGNGQYLWSPGIVAGQPNVLLDRPVLLSEYAPNTFTTGLYVGIFGNFRFYWIADALSMTVQRLVELYAATNQTGFIGRLETDGAPVLAEAFARVKLA